jgi:hypothetical protein
VNKLLTKISATALLIALVGPAFADQHEKTVFVTKASFKGDLGRLAGADEKCQAEADDLASIVPSGTYLAWLSDGTNSPDTRFAKSSDPYVLPDGTKIAEDFADLSDGSILQSINITPDGKSLGVQIFWAATNANGTTAQSFLTCAGWTNSTGKFRGAVGGTDKTSTLWSERSMKRCGLTARLACFQQ